MSWPAPLATRLEGRIVTLAPLAAEHEDALWDVGQDPAIWRWMLGNYGASREAFHGYFQTALAQTAAGAEAAFVTLDAATGRPLGSTRFMALRPEHRGLEIGHTWVTPAAWGTGANTEAKLLQLRHCFETLGCMRVEFKTDARNERSRAALAALPARFEGIFRKHMLVRGGELRDSAYYAIVDEDWPDVRAALEARISRS
jgi:RimJ/RimL family protein N-acetyltransferase